MPMRRVLLEFKNISQKIFTELTNQLRNVSVTVYVLFMLFGLVSWTAANGVLSESPVLTAILPECYRLTSIIVIIVQFANIGPIVYLVIWLIVKLTCKKTFSLSIVAIYSTLIFALVASVCLSIFWSKETRISDRTISFSFFILTGCLAISDCTTTVLFLPFVALYPSAYISALYIGEGLSGVVPSLWALIQGSPSRECFQTGSIKGVRFTPTLYFLVITLVTVISLIAFTLILLLPRARRERQNISATLLSHPSVDSDTTVNDGENITQTNNPSCGSYINLVYYISIQIILCVFANSFLYSIAPYFTLPYGSSTFLWALNLTLIAVPIGSLLGGLFIPRNILTLWYLLAAYMLISIWLIFLAVWGEHKPLQGSIIGELHVILLLSFTGLIAGYVKVGVGVLAKNEGGPTYMLIIAIATQVGSFIGGLAAFLLVNYTQIFSL